MFLSAINYLFVCVPDNSKSSEQMFLISLYVQGLTKEEDITFWESIVDTKYSVFF